MIMEIEGDEPGFLQIFPHDAGVVTAMSESARPLDTDSVHSNDLLQ